MIGIIAAGLCGWRLASLFVHEMGPFDLFWRIRQWAGLSEQPGLVTTRPLIGGVLMCLWCASVWTAAGSWLVWEYVAEWPVAIMAAAAIAILAEGFARNAR